MTTLRFRVDETFDVAGRGGLLVSGTGLGLDLVGVPVCRDEATGRHLHVLGVDFPTAETRRTGRTVLILDRQDAEYATAGRTWLVEA